MAKRKTISAQDTFTDRDMILDPNRWPRWPWLPVKKDITKPDNCGIIVEAEGYYDRKGKIAVVFANLWDGEQMTHLADQRKVEYDNVDALIADGWVVD